LLKIEDRRGYIQNHLDTKITQNIFNFYEGSFENIVLFLSCGGRVGASLPQLLLGRHGQAIAAAA
jgi:hypothetical protein